ncbi:MAG: MFS transporter [Myxococcales bacterium]|nr:MFS transporter [Myxococcales bacterium]
MRTARARQTRPSWLRVTIGSPYFSPFMLGELHLSYAQYTAGTLVVVATKLATLPGWGRRIDRLGARAVVIGAAILIATVPFPWLFARGFGVVVLAQALSGLAWGGYEVSQYTLLLDSADARRRPALLAVVNVLNGLAQLGGTLIGAAALAFGGGDYRAVFLTTFVARLTAAASMWFILPAHGLGGHLRASRLRLRLFGWSAATGPMLRPMPRDAEASGFVDTTELAGEADARRD